MIRWPTLDELLGVIALFAFAGAAVLAIDPTLLPPPALEAVSTIEERIDLRRSLIVVAVAIGAFALWRIYASGATGVGDGFVDDPAQRSPRSGSEAASGTRVIGDRTTREVDRTIAALKRGNRAEPDAIRGTLRETLREIEIARGRSDTAAERRIDAGDWTDDETAAAFVGGPSAGRHSFLQRLLAWLFPGHVFERWLEVALEEIERYAEHPDRTGARSTAATSAASEAGSEPVIDGTASGATADGTASEPTTDGTHPTPTAGGNDA